MELLNKLNSTLRHLLCCLRPFQRLQTGLVLENLPMRAVVLLVLAKAPEYTGFFSGFWEELETSSDKTRTASIKAFAS